MAFNRHTLLVLASVVAVLGGTFFVLNQSREEAPKVRIGYLNITASLPFFVAEEKGFFAEEGISYEAFPLTTSNQLVDGIVANNLDVFPESSAVPVLAVELQSPGRMKVFSVSTITKDSPFDSLLVKNDSSIRTISDLAGKKIGVFPGSTATTLLKKYLADHNIDTSAIHLIPLPPQNQILALLEGSVDVVHAYEPTTAIAINAGMIRKLNGSVYAEMLDPNPQGVAAISTKFIEKYPEEAKKVVRALEKAMLFMRDNETESRNIMASRLKIDQSIADTSVFLYMVPHKSIDVRVFQRYADMLSELGELKGHVDVANIVYND